MRFLLVEAVPTVDPSDIEVWKVANDKERSKILTKIIRGYGVNEDDPNWRPALRYACYRFGIDPKRNPFIEWFDTFSNKNDVFAESDQLTYLIKQYEKGILSDLSSDWLFDKDLYSRNQKEFEYTAGILSTVSNPKAISKYFHNTENISVSQLYDDSGKLKPAGSPSTADDLNTIFGTVESWSGTDSENEIVQDPREKQKAVRDTISKTEKARIKKASDTGKTLDDYDNPQQGDRVWVNARSHTIGDNTTDDWMTAGQGYYEFDSKQWRMLAPGI